MPFVGLMRVDCVYTLYEQKIDKLYRFKQFESKSDYR